VRLFEAEPEGETPSDGIGGKSFENATEGRLSDVMRKGKGEGSSKKTHAHSLGDEPSTARGGREQGASANNENGKPCRARVHSEKDT